MFQSFVSHPMLPLIVASFIGLIGIVVMFLCVNTETDEVKAILEEQKEWEDNMKARLDLLSAQSKALDERDIDLFKKLSEKA